MRTGDVDRYADLAGALAMTFAYSVAHRGPLPGIAGTVAAFGSILASYVTKDFATRQERPYPNDILNRLKRRPLRRRLICIGAVVGRPFESLLLAGAYPTLA